MSPALPQRSLILEEGGAVIHGRAAAVLLRALGGRWRRELRGVDAELRADLEQAVDALRGAASAWGERLRVDRASAGGSAEPQRKSDAPASEAWITPQEAESTYGLTDRRWRQLAADGRIEAVKVSGRWQLRRAAVEAWRDGDDNRTARG